MAVLEFEGLIASSEHRFTFGYVSQLDRGTSTALATIREWRNSFVPINRAPSEVLSLIPTHLSRVKDLFRASAVCRHWRRTFIQNAALWSRMHLTIRKSNFFVKTLLERAKGSALYITSTRLDRADIFTLLSPHAQQIRTLRFVDDYWSDIQRFSESAPGPLPLLHTLRINAIGFDMLGNRTVNPPSLPLFSGAVNLKKFILYSEGAPYLNHFTFPNLTTFELNAMPVRFPASQLLNFLEASPTLRTVRIEIEAEIDTGDLPPERVVVLPNVEIFTIIEGEPGYNIAALISCPSARCTSLVFEHYAFYEPSRQAFPTSVSWNAIVAQYTAGPIEEVMLSVITAWELVLSCSLSFISPGPAILELGYRAIAQEDDDNDTEISLGEKHAGVVSQACVVIRNHPLLYNIKRLRIRDSHVSLTSDQLTHVAKEAVQLFKSVGPLEELTLNVVDLRPYLAPCLGLPEFRDVKQPDVFPAIKELTIVGRLKESLKEECMTAVVEWAKSQHSLGVPFECVTFRVRDPPFTMVERLGPWVGTVHLGELMFLRDDPV